MGSNSKIFVAGHNGLVGSAIVRNLEAKDLQISSQWIEQNSTLQSYMMFRYSSQ